MRFAKEDYTGLSTTDLAVVDLAGATLTAITYDEETRWPKGIVLSSSLE